MDLTLQQASHLSLSATLAVCVMSSCTGTGARPLAVWCMPWPQVLHVSVDVVSCASSFFSSSSPTAPASSPRAVLSCIAFYADPSECCPLDYKPLKYIQYNKTNNY